MTEGNTLQGRKASFFKGALILSAGSLAAKIIGALYRIPLTNLLGAEGIGVYQTAFPVYCILLTFSSTGVPAALARLSAAEKSGENILKSALKLFIPLGFAGFLLMAATAGLLAKAQGNEGATAAYIALSPSVALVAFISCIRGYFQGKNDMLPTAASQVAEQAVKLAAGLSLCRIFSYDPVKAGAAACAAVTVSEGVAALYLAAKYKRRKGDNEALSPTPYPLKKIISTVIPITLSAILLPLARLYDGFTIINFLKVYRTDATSLYGIYTGAVESVVGVPVAVCYGAAAAVLPLATGAFSSGDGKRAYSQCGKALALTFISSLLAAIVLYFLAYKATGILFGGLSGSERETTARLLKASAGNIVALSVLQTLTSCLVAAGKTYAPCAFLSIGVLFKCLMQPFLLKIPALNIFAPLISDFACYFLAVFGNLVYIIMVNEKNNAREREGVNHENNTCGDRH